MTARPPSLGRARRAVAMAGRVLGLGVVFVSALLAAIPLHFRSKGVRRLVRDSVNEALAPLFQGRIVIARIDRISLSGVDVGDASVFDPEGRAVIRGLGIHARVDLLTMAREIALRKNEMLVRIPFIHLDVGNVVLNQSPNGLTIAEAFTMPPSPPLPPTATPGKPVRVELERIELGHVWAHGALAPPRMLDAELDGVVGHIHVGEDGFRLDVEPTPIKDRSFLPGPTAGTADYHLRIAPGDFGMWAGFGGAVGDVPAKAEASMVNGHVSLQADVDHASAPAFLKLFPGVPVREGFSAKVKGEGDLPRLEVTADVAVEGVKPGSAHVDADVDLSWPLRVRADVATNDLDPNAFVVAPKITPVTMTARADLFVDGKLHGQAEAQTKAFEVEGQPIPAARVVASIDGDLVTGGADLDEPGAPTSATFTFSPRGGLAFSATTDVPRLAASRRIPKGALEGGARAKVDGTLKDGALDAKVHASFFGLGSNGAFKIDSGTVDGRVKGPLAALDLDASVNGEGVSSAGYAFDHLKAHASGSILAPRVEARLDSGNHDEIVASAQIDPKARGARSVKVKIERDDAKVEGTIAKIGVEHGGIAIEGVDLSGPAVGALAGTLRVEGNDLVGKLHGESVDLGKVAHLAGVSAPMKGLADLDIDLVHGKNGRSGHIDVALEDGEFSLLTGVSAQVAMTIEDGHVKGAGFVRLVAKAVPGDKSETLCDGTIAKINLLDGDAKIDGPLLDPKTWERATGKIMIDAPNWDLRCLARLGPTSLVLSEVKGKLSTHALVERKAGARFVSVKDFSMGTRGLELAAATKFGSDDKPAWESRLVDVEVKGALDGESGKSNASVTLLSGAPLVTVSAASKLDLAALVDHPEHAKALLEATPASVDVDVPRALVGNFTEAFKSFVSRLPIEGEVALKAHAEGTFLAPRVAVEATAWNIGAAIEPAADNNPTPNAPPAAAGDWAFPVDAKISATWDGEKAKGTVEATRDDKIVATADADFDVPWKSVLEGAVAWRGDVRAKLDDIKATDIPFFADRGVKGRLTGTVDALSLHDAPTVDVALTIDGLEIGDDLPFERGTVALKLDRKSGEAKDHATLTTNVDLTDKKGGSLKVQGYAALVLKNGLVPVVDDKGTASLELDAKRFRLRAAQPFVSAAVSRLDGMLDGKIAVTKSSADARTSLDASLVVTKGVVNLPQLGQELKNARLTLKSKGGDLDVPEIYAEGVRGKINGKGNVHLDEQLGFKSAHVEIEIKKGEDLPFTLEGVPLGEGYGEIAVDATKKDRSVALVVKVPYLFLELPSDTGKAVQPLDDNAEIAISHPVGPPPPDRAPNALAFDVDLDISQAVLEGKNVAGNDVWVSLRSGKKHPHILVTDKARGSGDIRLTGCRFAFMGKQFSVDETDNALIHLRDEIGNPYLNVSAHWDSPDGNEIFIDYTGELFPILGSKIHFRSSATQDQNAILNTLLFGSDLESNQGLQGATPGGTGGSAANNVATGAGGALAAAQLNQALAGIGPLKGLTTRFGSADDGGLKTSLVYQIGDKVSAVASFENATGQTTGANTAGGMAAARSNTTEVSIDWHFMKHWMLSGKVGVGGTEGTTSGLDLLWQYRY